MPALVPAPGVQKGAECGRESRCGLEALQERVGVGGEGRGHHTGLAGGRRFVVSTTDPPDSAGPGGKRPALHAHLRGCDLPTQNRPLQTRQRGSEEARSEPRLPPSPGKGREGREGAEEGREEEEVREEGEGRGYLSRRGG